jgi:hypothetical protein
LRVNNVLLVGTFEQIRVMNSITLVTLFKNVIVHENCTLFKHEQNLRL